MPTVPDIHRRGTRAAQATIAAPPLTVGTLYFVTDEGVTERWTGSAWESYSGPGAGGAPAAHAASHASGGSDPVPVTTLAGYPGGTTSFLRADGTFAAAGGGGATWLPALTTPITGDFTWINQGTAALTVNANGGLFLEDATAGSLNLRVRKKAAPATPYTITTAWLPQLRKDNSSGFGIGWRQSSDGKLIIFAVRWASNLSFTVDRYSSPTAFFSTYNMEDVAFPSTPFFLRIADDGTSRDCLWSLDGYHFRSMWTVSRTDFLTADEVFFGLYINTIRTAATLVSWSQP